MNPTKTIHNNMTYVNEHKVIEDVLIRANMISTEDGFISEIPAFFIRSFDNLTGLFKTTDEQLNVFDPKAVSVLTKEMNKRTKDITEITSRGKYYELEKIKIPTMAGFNSTLLNASVILNRHLANINKETLPMLDLYKTQLLKYIADANARKQLKPLKVAEQILDANIVYSNDFKDIVSPTDKEDRKPFGKLLNNLSELTDIYANLNDNKHIASKKNLELLKSKIKEVNALANDLYEIAADDEAGIISKNVIVYITKLLTELAKYTSNITTSLYLYNETVAIFNTTISIAIKRV